MKDMIRHVVGLPPKIYLPCRPSLQYKSGIFKVPNIGGWMVVLTSGKLVEELRQATDNELSFMDAVKEVQCKVYP